MSINSRLVLERDRLLALADRMETELAQQQPVIAAALEYHDSEVMGNVGRPRVDVRADFDAAIEYYRRAVGLSGVAQSSTAGA